MGNATSRLLRMRRVRHALWRVGRRLYRTARGDVPNNMHTNGERWLQRKVLDHHVRTDATLIIWDIGANVGEWTEYLVEELARRRMADRVEIHAFEPIEATYRELCQRVDAMGRGTNVSVVPKAVSNKTETVRMYIVDELAGTNSLYPFGTSGEGSVVTVPAITAEAYAEMRGIQRLHLVKCWSQR